MGEDQDYPALVELLFPVSGDFDADGFEGGEEEGLVDEGGVEG